MSDDLRKLIGPQTDSHTIDSAAIGGGMTTMLADAVAKAKPAGAKGTYIQRVAVSSTMGPGVKVEPGSLHD